MAPDIIYDAGDLRLKVGGKQYPEEQLEFVVNSKALARASRRFKKLLHNKLQPSTKSTTLTQNLTVKLPEDDPVGLEVLLNIIHGEYDLSTSTIPLSLLSRILAVSEKYNMSHLIRPWVNVWFQPDADLLHKPADNRLLLRVAWMVGAIDVFKRAVKTIYQECQVNYEGQLLGIWKNPLVDDIELERIFENIGQLRFQIINHAIGLLESCIMALWKGEWTMCRYNLGGGVCDLKTLGSLTNRLSANDLESALEHTPYRHSVNHLIETLEKISATMLEGSHPECNPLPGIIRRIRETAENLENAMIQQYLDHLLRQKEKTGLINEY